jgi:hypothetical protein
MLFVSTDVRTFAEFRDRFHADNGGRRVIDMSKVPSAMLATEAATVCAHHANVAVFLGYLEPGWMLDAAHQTAMRAMIRKFPVGMVCHFVESLPFSWKNEINTVYTARPINGSAPAVHDGCALQHEPPV